MQFAIALFALTLTLASCGGKGEKKEGDKVQDTISATPPAKNDTIGLGDTINKKPTAPGDVKGPEMKPVEPGTQN